MHNKLYDGENTTDNSHECSIVRRKLNRIEKKEFCTLTCITGNL